MKKILKLICCLGVILLVSGCGTSNGGVKKVNCKSEAIGENPTNVYYEEYVVQDNKVAHFNKYSILSYDNEYLKKISLDDIVEVYTKSNLYEVTKLSNTEIKLTYKEAVNVFETSTSDNLVETIVSTLEDNEFALYKYACEVK